MRPFLRRAKPAAAEKAAPAVSGMAEILTLADAELAGARHDAARALYRSALDADAVNVYAHYQLARSHLATGDLPAAWEWCDRGLAIEPDQIGLLLLLAKVSESRGDPLLAVQCYRRILAVDPSVEEVASKLAVQLCWIGRIDESIEQFDRAIAQARDATMIASNRLFTLNYTDRVSPETIAAEHRAWGMSCESKLWDRNAGWDNARDPERRLRVGYVSPDLRTHAVAYFVEPLLAHHDKQRYEILCFNTVPQFHDDVTDQ